jgi:hypothetical protein
VGFGGIQWTTPRYLEDKPLTKRNGTDAKIIKFLSAFPDVKEYHH